MSFVTLKAQVKTILENTDKFSEVVAYPKLNFVGYPSATITPAENESIYHTTDENQRIYAFAVRCFYETKDGGVENAIDALADLVDDVIDAFDQDSLKSSDRVVGKNLPSGYTYIDVFATPSRWAEILDPALLMAEVMVRVKVIVDISS